MTVEIVSTYGSAPHSEIGKNQVAMPNYLTGSFVGDDADNHDFKMSGRGKGRMSVTVRNPTDKEATVTLYGAHSATADVGDEGVVEIGGSGEGSFTVAAGATEYQVVNDPFPFYIVRVVLGAGPDGSTVTMFIDFQQQ